MSCDTGMVFVQTPMVKSLHDTLKRWVWCGFTGGVIVGDPRLGKSWAVDALGNTMPSARGESIQIFTVSFGQRDGATIRSVYVHLARALGHTKITNSTRADDLQNFLFHKLADASLTNERRQVVIVADEVQELTVHQLSVFAEIFNDQDRAKNRLVIIFIANTQRFKSMAEQLLLEENSYLRQRFFQNIYRFYGIRTLSELRECLAFYDAYRVDPENTASIIDIHCAAMRKDGVSLADLAETIWEVFDERYAKPLKLESWGMSYFQCTMNILVMDYLAHFWRHDKETIRTLVENSIAASDLVPELTSIASCNA